MKSRPSLPVYTLENPSNYQKSYKLKINWVKLILLIGAIVVVCICIYLYYLSIMLLYNHEQNTLLQLSTGSSIKNYCELTIFDDCIKQDSFCKANGNVSPCNPASKYYDKYLCNNTSIEWAIDDCGKWLINDLNYIKKCDKYGDYIKFVVSDNLQICEAHSPPLGIAGVVLFTIFILPIMFTLYYALVNLYRV